MSGDDLARLYDLDVDDERGDLDLHLALADRAGGNVVELAVGTGRLAVPLAQAGHDVLGIDHDPAMLARARARAESAGSDVAARVHLLEADMVDLPPDQLPGLSGRASLAILGLNSILVLPSRERQRAVLSTMAGLLAPGGTAVVDAWQPAIEDLAAFDGRLSLEWLRADPETGDQVSKTVAAWYDPTTRLVTLTTIFDAAPPGGDLRRWTRVDALRLVSPDELVTFAEDAGLEVETLAGDHDLSPLDAGSERAVLVARKRE